MSSLKHSNAFLTRLYYIRKFCSKHKITSENYNNFVNNFNITKRLSFYELHRALWLMFDCQLNLNTFSKFNDYDLLTLFNNLFDEDVKKHLNFTECYTNTLKQSPENPW